ncbi:Cof-type HAD-IIB family hydrolase [Alkalicoccus urumqiensis]|uniref:Cof-type HAD-IIB family hydrolase n=1 Tax=Alkalicoccus urumqiensis TaxID=1548213 RepID=A0A2P6MLG3_ALKUR|nr:Cof-type HAD-IIB family hydrolase [Alkalicoccus urumqiensis]PRO67113.1 Cof-type HAD-IIB family hydrolase [Alkalicoccus urumqiensis]
MKLIAIDLDGTLLNDEKVIPEENLEAIKEAQDAGVEVVIATGRAVFDVQRLIEPTNFRPWIINMNGASIHQPDGTLFYDQPIHQDKARPVLEWLHENGYYYEVTTAERLIAPHDGLDRLEAERHAVDPASAEGVFFEKIFSGQFSQSSRIPEKDPLQAASEETIYNILALSFLPEKLQTGWERYEEHPDFNLVASASINFELQHADASKGAAVQRLAGHLGISTTETAAIGDSLNDLSMIHLAGRGIAMSNAAPQVKEAADEVTLSNHDFGVAAAIRGMLQNIQAT